MTSQTQTAAASNTDGDKSAPATNSDATKVAPATDATTKQQPTEGDATKTGDGDKKPDAAADGKTKADDKTDKSDDGKGKDGDKSADKKDDAKPAPKAPEKYELKLAEGVKLTPEVQTQFEAIARELDLPPEAAQKLIDLAPELNKMQTAQLIEVANKKSDEWHEETRNDKELGGGGDKAAYDATMSLVARTRDTFATPELISLLQRFDAKKNPNGTGLGNHPEVIRLFARIGKSLSEDSKLVVGTTPKAHAEAADKLYPSTTKK